MKVLITVGTTSFDTLLRYTDTHEFVSFLTGLGFNEITYQIGSTGNYQPKHGKNFKLSPNIDQIYKQSDLIITHGGAGTLLSNLYLGKKIVAIANQELMGNHQAQLVRRLDFDGYLLGFLSVQHLKNQLQKLADFIRNKSLKPFEQPQRCLLNQLVFN